jgi:general secretion pathway protein M
MNKRVHTPYSRCLLAWVAVILLPSLIIVAVMLPWWSKLQDLSEQIDTDRHQIDRFQRVVASLPSLREALQRERSNDDYKAYSFDEATPALAGARLQREVQEMIRAVNARPISAQVLPADGGSSPPQVRIRVQIQADTDQLFELLYRLEEAEPFLFVDQMSIRSTSSRARRVSRNRQPNRREETDTLTVRLDIFGYSLRASP